MEVLDFLAPYRGGQELEGLKALDEQFLIKNRIRNGKVLLKYHRQADKSKKIVRECRGLILTLDGFEPVSVPMEKFGNYGEAYAPKSIDIRNYNVVEKVDGTCCGMYWDQVNGKWHVQTLSQPEGHEIVNAFDMDPNAGILTNKTWSELFWDVFKQYSRLELLDRLDKGYTYMFELCTPWNRVVVRHATPKLYFLGLRSKVNFLELAPNKCVLYGLFDLPKVYTYGDLDQLLKVAAEQLGKEDEGFVLVDENFTRVKVKSAQYVQEHYESTIVTVNSIVGVVMQDEQDEWVAVFPEFTKVVAAIVAEIDRVGKLIDDYGDTARTELNNEQDMEKVTQWFLGQKLSKRKNYFEKRYFYFAYKQERKGKDMITTYTDHGMLVSRVREFVEYSNIRELVNCNRDTMSLR